MAYQVVSRVFEHSQHSGAALLALVALAEFADRDGVTWRGNQALADRLRCKPRAAIRALAMLRDSGELYALPNAGGRKHTTTKFITTGLDAGQIEAVLCGRFGMNPATAAAVAAGLVAGRNHANIDTDSVINHANNNTASRANIDTDNAETVQILTHNRANIDTRSGIEPVKDQPVKGSGKKTRAPVILSKLDPTAPGRGEVDARILALADVCELDTSIPDHRRRLDHAAANLYKWPAATISERYTRPENGQVSGWNWYRHDWRGQKNQAPTPGQVVETITKKPPPAAQTAPAGRMSAADRVSAALANSAALGDQ